MKINKRIQTEYLLNNIVDQDFQAMLFPLNVVQYCFLMPMFSIINNFITPDNHLSSYIQSIIGCTALTLTHQKQLSTYVFFFLAFPGMRKTCKNVLRLSRASLRKMSAFGVFELDATFPLRLLSVMVIYTVVLLQFAFLS
ncbi:uncharacterized protein LOC134658181 [Cydia amplana]|uniref:uncharacterized protein LOC134658181 n=1 Tax=Cydia amplana TaxID=1869771 RepID=UPI002FE5765F